jgi:arylsulfatase A
MQVDFHMGQLMDTLKQCGIENETLLIFTSDNGCSPQGNFKVLKKHGHDPSAGFRGHKADIYEGGHRVPLIIRWPGHMDEGATSQALACLTDIFPTLESITGQTKVETGGEDGFDLSPVFKGAKSSGRETLISHSIGGAFAIRKGPWKLCISRGSGGWSAPREPDARKQGLPSMQLFNLNQDRAETNNLILKNPAKAEELLKILEKEVTAGRCSPGKPVKNDREVVFIA